MTSKIMFSKFKDRFKPIKRSELIWKSCRGRSRLEQISAKEREGGREGGRDNCRYRAPAKHSLVGAKTIPERFISY